MARSSTNSSTISSSFGISTKRTEPHPSPDHIGSGTRRNHPRSSPNHIGRPTDRAHSSSLRKLSNSALLHQLEKLRGAERSVLLKILRYLGEVDRRRLYLPRGYSSLFEFCTGYLKYSRSAAGRRIHAARCIERFPRVAGMLLSGDVTLTVVSMISSILTNENAAEILSWIKGKSTRDVEMLVSRHRPGFFLRDRVRPICLMMEHPAAGDASSLKHTGGENARIEHRVARRNMQINNALDISDPRIITPGAGSKCKAGLTSISPTESDSGDGDDRRIHHCNTLHHGTGEASVEGKTEHVLITQKFRLEFVVEPEFMEKLSRVKSLLSTKHPKGISFEQLFDTLLDEYLAHHDPKNRNKKRSEVKRQTKEKNPNKANRSTNVNQTAARATSKTRHIPKSVRDEVFKRDGGRCTFVGEDGKRCNSDWNLQIDHILPYAKGGDSSPGNLRLLCAKHNRLAAEKEYGKDFMHKYK